MSGVWCLVVWCLVVWCLVTRHQTTRHQTLACLHLPRLAAGAIESLELQVGESDLTQALVRGVEPTFADGCFVAPSTPGFGIELDDAVLRAHPYRPVPPGLDERLG